MLIHGAAPDGYAASGERIARAVPLLLVVVAALLSPLLYDFSQWLPAFLGR